MPFINLKVSQELYEELGLSRNMELERSDSNGGVKFKPLSNILNHVFCDYKNYVSPLLTSPLFGNRSESKDASTEIDPEIISNEPVINTVVVPAKCVIGKATKSLEGSHKKSVESSSLNEQVTTSKENTTLNDNCDVEIHTNQSQNSVNISETVDTSEGLLFQDVELSNRYENLFGSSSESSHQECFVSNSSTLVDQVSLGHEVIISSSDSDAVVGQSNVMSTSSISHMEFSDNFNVSQACDTLMLLDSENAPKNMSSPSQTPVSSRIKKKDCKEKEKKSKISNFMNHNYNSSSNKRDSRTYPRQCEKCLKFLKCKGSFFVHKKACGQESSKLTKAGKKRITLKCPNCSIDFSSSMVHQVHVSNCKRRIS